MDIIPVYSIGWSKPLNRTSCYSRAHQWKILFFFSHDFMGTAWIARGKLETAVRGQLSSPEPTISVGFFLLMSQGKVTGTALRYKRAFTVTW